jgi:TP901 family phage tail tape measure protein
MAERRVSVKFSAEIAGFKAAMAEAAAATRKVKDSSEEASKAADTHLGRLVQSATKNQDAWETTGATFLGLGTAAVTGLGLAGKAAMDWESAWAGVTKTVDGTPEQMAELEGSLRDLAKTLPATHEEIAGVAEAAGQLGVKREDVVGFTETMIALGETTNLTADEAATSIAQISNVMGTMERDGSEGVERFSATLVALGNAGASTEAEIVSMAQRIAGAGKLVGASESDVLALANAMASVGIEAELGGGVISRVMQRMYADVKTGGEGLDRLAKVAGVSSKEFATAFETDPVRAVDAVVKGLSRVKAEGGNVVETMADLGIKGTEETSVLLRLAGAGDLLADSLKLGDEAWASNSALAEEAAKRYETTESKVQLAWNNIKDAAIDAGAVLLPIIAGVAESTAGVAQAFGSLPDPVKGALSVLGGVAGVAALGAGAFLNLTPKILESMQAFDKLAPAGSKARGVLGASAGVVGKAAVAYTALATAATLANAATEENRRKTTVQDFNNALLGTATNGAAAEKALDAAFNGVLKTDLMTGGTTNVNSFADALDRIYHASPQDSLTDFRDTFFGQNASSGINAAKDAIGNYDKALAAMATSGNFKDSAAGFQLAAEKAKENGDSIEDLVELFPAYKDAILANKTANGESQVSQESLTEAMLNGGTAAEVAADGVKGAGDAASGAAPLTEEMSEALADVGLAANGTVTDLVKFTDALLNAGLLQLSARDAARNYQAAIDGVTDSIATNGTSLDINTEQGRANQAALDAVASAGLQVVKSNAANGASQKTLQGNLRTTYDNLITSAGQFGITGGKADELARKVLGIPAKANINSWMSDAAKRMAQETGAAVDAVNGKTANVYVNTYKTEFHRVERSESVSTGSGARRDGQRDAFATGGRIPAFADGGRLPTTGPGTEVTDGFLGVDAFGVPRARLDGGEWIINDFSSDRYNRELAAINAGTFPKLPGFANGGREYSAREFGYSSTASAVAAGPMEMVGTLELNSDATMATFRGIARAEASGAVTRADKQTRYSRTGR